MADEAEQVEAPLTLDDIEPELTSKASIVALLRDEPTLAYEAIAAFVLVRVEGRAPPLDEPLLQRTAKKLRQLPVDQRKGQERAASADVSLTRVRPRSGSRDRDGRSPNQDGRPRKESKTKRRKP